MTKKKKLLLSLLQQLLLWLMMLIVMTLHLGHAAVEAAIGATNWKNAHSIYDFSAVDIDGKLVSLERYRNIKWNFTKFLIDKHGHPFRRYAPKVNPKEIESDLVKLFMSP
ncbi:hypothetical protein HELRODRAFT_177002 [Helobdella robusta]|uniref:Glutathione peroxidase n=1 Tax=Helobdella robusta TaxID=6412 RepID=T1FB44_HELRO|nr:hypothetical protein HELRODRAFT_177002 [Helobdella robusta]ESN98523.1 hypothetical protein HELRODRAFT_177002 [Helobdella robusta]